MNNLWLKALSLFLALAVWFVVSAPRREAVSERAYAVPVSLARMPRELWRSAPGRLRQRAGK